MEEQKKDSAVKVGDLVSALIDRLDHEKIIHEEQILEAWKEIVGEKASQYAKPYSLAKGCLKVLVENPGWIQILKLQEREILKKLQIRFDRAVIQEIRFKTGVL